MQSRSTLTFSFLGSREPPAPGHAVPTPTRGPALRTSANPTHPPRRCFLFSRQPVQFLPGMWCAGRLQGTLYPWPAVPGETRRPFAPSCPLLLEGRTWQQAAQTCSEPDSCHYRTHSARPREAVFPGTSRLNQPQDSESHCFWGD